MTVRYHCVATLNAEWGRLVAGTAAQVETWAAREPALAGAGNVAAVLELVRQCPDQVLGALLRLGAAGDDLARRVVLQTMLGKLVRLYRGRPDEIEEAVSELWLTIAEYPLERRPRAIAPNLSWAVQRRMGQRRSLPAPVCDTRFAPVATEPGASHTLALARRLGVIDEVTHQTLWTVYVAGLTSAEAAVALGTTAAGVRWRCSRAVRRLRAQATLLAG